MSIKSKISGMSRIALKPIKGLRNKIGKPPGTLVYTGTEESVETALYFVSYDETNVEDYGKCDLDHIISNLNSEGINWIKVRGLVDTTMIEAIGQQFGIHPLAQEDILNAAQLPKAEDFEDFFFFTLKGLSYDEERDIVEQDHISFVLGNNFLISFQEREHGLFDNILERIKTGNGKVRKKNVDYLFYLLIDTIVDHYYLLIEALNNSANELELELIEDPEKQLINKIIHEKKQLILMQRVIVPLRDALRKLQTEDTDLLLDSNAHNFNDIFDHLQSIIESFYILREMYSGFIDLYMSTVNNKMNEVMKTLTLVSTIFIPLTFLAGIYGMNFSNMPELNWHYGYFVILGLMVVIGVSMFIVMKRRHWF